MRYENNQHKELNFSIKGFFPKYFLYLSYYIRNSVIKIVYSRFYLVFYFKIFNVVSFYAYVIFTRHFSLLKFLKFWKMGICFLLISSYFTWIFFFLVGLLYWGIEKSHRVPNQASKTGAEIIHSVRSPLYGHDQRWKRWCIVGVKQKLFWQMEPCLLQFLIWFVK